MAGRFYDTVTDDWPVREASDDDRLAVRRLLDAALLEVDGLDDAIDAGAVLVALADRREGDNVVPEARVVGAAVLDVRSDSRGTDSRVHVEAIAVRRRRRDRGIGTTLVEAALAEAESTGAAWLTAGFDESLEPFYTSLGFSIESGDEPGRLRGRLAVSGRSDPS